MQSQASKIILSTVIVICGGVYFWQNQKNPQGSHTVAVVNDSKQSTVQFKDGGLGGFQEAKFTPNESYTGGDLNFGSHIYEVDFVNSAVKLKS